MQLNKSFLKCQLPERGSFHHWFFFSTEWINKDFIFLLGVGINLALLNLQQLSPAVVFDTDQLFCKGIIWRKGRQSSHNRWVNIYLILCTGCWLTVCLPQVLVVSMRKVVTHFYKEFSDYMTVYNFFPFAVNIVKALTETFSSQQGLSSHFEISDCFLGVVLWCITHDFL